MIKTKTTKTIQAQINEGRKTLKTSESCVQTVIESETKYLMKQK